METQFHQKHGFLGIDKSYISEFVYGGIDGAITTFAVVAGAAGANLDISVVIILGMANLIADGFSMSVGNFFSTQAERDNYDKHRAVENWEIDNLPDQEVEEIRQIYAAKGFEGELLEQVVATIVANRELWLDTMMREELGLMQDDKTPHKTAGVTFFSFIAIGVIPLLSYLLVSFFPALRSNLFLISCIATGLALAIIGQLKSIVTGKSRLRGTLETVGLGGLAAFIAYYVGFVLEKIVLN
ncbi:VIT1/CCC1 transporter family protein [Adhaeribacter sp. BT258]|uniref:VIT1/CCC1 transporter family protein n=1 Tax=Adhaeribacter terrigena TaxID=2793070 RepID=A0ABS1C5N7_9BACT|nr:VIT1/CCC1 transporter family protein [Adhaeribacter terrigena]MBK0404672.1 VIT1/CCC1 transporter family protein [Adhaeribacter terrigena]